jgi:phospholipid/cholesterol/gamma-HCH transport system substrate-binding protein
MTQASRSINVGTGLFVVLGFVAVGYLTAQIPGNSLRFSRPTRSYTITAKFENIGGLKIAAPVKIAGVRVGVVEAIRFDSSDYKAEVALDIESRYGRIPLDSGAAILTSGLLGGNYIAITPGASASFLRAGSQIGITQSAFGMERLINKLFASFAGKGGQAASGDGSK